MKNALILGASGDIGQAIARRLAADGWSLYCHYYQHAEKVVRLVKDLRNGYPKQDFFMVSLNMLDESGLPAFYDQLFQVDAVIFASGFTHYQLLSDMTSAMLEELWQIHLKLPIMLCRDLQTKLSHSGCGRVVFIGSVYGQMGSSMETVYSAVKGGQEAFAKAYSQEVASLGITVNVVAPGAVATSMNRHWTDAELESLQAEIPVGRMGQPEEIAAAVAFLVAEQSNYITGITLPVNGGWY